MISAKLLPQDGYGCISLHEDGVTDTAMQLREVTTVLQTSHQQGQTMCQKSASLRRLTELKRELAELMTLHRGSTKHPDVAKAVEKLAECNPYKHSGCAESRSFVGNFLLASCPDFPGRLPPIEGREDCIQYTLGRMSFNQFQPRNLVCTLTSVESPVTLITETSDSDLDELDTIHDVGGASRSYSYPLVQNIIAHTPEGVDLPGKIVHEAICRQEESKVSNRFSVLFTGTTLEPAHEVQANPDRFKAWMEVFHQHNADKLTVQGGMISLKSYYPTILDTFQHHGIDQMSRTATNILPPFVSPSVSCRGKFHVDYKARNRGGPKGYIDVLYLDDEMRITRGNRGTITVVYRSNRIPPTY